MHKRKTFFMGFCLILMSSIELLFGCTCAPHGTPAEEYEKRDFVYSGRVVEINNDTTFYPSIHFIIVDVEILHSWKGSSIDTFTVFTGAYDGICGYAFEIDSVYLIYADSSQIYAPFGDTLSTRIYTDQCRRTERLSLANEDLEFLNNLSVEEPGGVASRLPDTYSIHQNHPNPFNPVTTIRYELPRFSHVRLSVYDILGREIAILGDGDQRPGVREVQWDASNVPSGIYFIQMVAGDFRQVRKVMVLK